jgi:hypothetical protein
MTNYSTYEVKSDNATVNAQRNLAGKTHYVDADTLRFHKSKILDTFITDNGLIFALIESCAADMHNTKRIFRPVIFDVLGKVIDRVSLDDGYKTSKQAVKAMWEALNNLDAKQLTIDACERQAQWDAQQIDRLKQLAA